MSDTYVYAEAAAGYAKAPSSSKRSRQGSTSSRVSQSSVYIDQYVSLSPNDTLSPPASLPPRGPSAQLLQLPQTQTQRSRAPSRTGPAQASAAASRSPSGSGPRVSLRPASSMRESSPGMQLSGRAGSRASITLKPRTDRRSDDASGGAQRLERARSTVDLNSNSSRTSFSSTSPERRILSLRPDSSSSSGSPDRRLQQFSPGSRSQTPLTRDAGLRRAQTLRPDALQSSRSHTSLDMRQGTSMARNGRASRPSSASPRRPISLTLSPQDARDGAPSQTYHVTQELRIDHVYENVPVTALPSPSRPESAYSMHSVYLHKEQLSPPFAEATLGVRPQDEALDPNFALANALPSQDPEVDTVCLPLITYSIIQETEEEHLAERNPEKLEGTGSSSSFRERPETPDFVQYYRFVRPKCGEQHESDLSVRTQLTHTLTLAGAQNGGIGPVTLESKELPIKEQTPNEPELPPLPEDIDEMGGRNKASSVRAKRGPMRKKADLTYVSRGLQAAGWKHFLFINIETV